MKRLLQKFEDIMVAVTFAEAGEYDFSRKMSPDTGSDEQEPEPEAEVETA
ncbi:MAG: hypothetical protein M1497_08230 [Nitrospirae bacterium]|nr:hypothetical protein [Nitrospirota bacterium]